MKNFKINLLAIFTIIFLLSSCSKDPETGLVGTWKTSDGGSVTFNSDGTGTSSNSDFFNWDCGTTTINGVSEFFGPVEDFKWTITNNGSVEDNVRLEYDDQTSFSRPCGGSQEWPVKVKSKNKATVGVKAFGIGIVIELTK